MSTPTRKLVPVSTTSTMIEPLPEWMTADEAARELRRNNRDAKALLKLHGVPVIEHTQRDWQVRRARVVGLLDELERKAAAALENADAQRDWLAPTAKRPKGAKR